MKLSTLLDYKIPYRVIQPDGKVRLIVMNANDGLPAAFALMGTRARHKVAIRIGGGCKGMNAANKKNMLHFFSEAFPGFRGLIGAGGTRQTEDGQLDPMITDVPGLIASQNEGCVALGTVPRTAMLSLQDDSRLVLDDWGTVPNPSMSGILIVQKSPDGELGWDGDVETYLTMMDNLKTYGGFTALGTIHWNGGAITADEIIKSGQRKWPTFLVKGSGRVTDEIVSAIETGNVAGDELDKLTNGQRDSLAALITQDRFTVVDKSDPQELRAHLLEKGFINLDG